MSDADAREAAGRHDSDGTGSGTGQGNEAWSGAAPPTRIQVAAPPAPNRTRCSSATNSSASCPG